MEALQKNNNETKPRQTKPNTDPDLEAIKLEVKNTNQDQPSKREETEGVRKRHPFVTSQTGVLSQDPSAPAGLDTDSDLVDSLMVTELNPQVERQDSQGDMEYFEVPENQQNDDGEEIVLKLKQESRPLCIYCSVINFLHIMALEILDYYQYYLKVSAE